MRTLDRLMDNSIFIILFLGSCLVDIVGIFVGNDGVESVLDSVSYWLFLAALIWAVILWCYERWRKWPMPDPLAGSRWAMALDKTLFAAIGVEFLLNLIALLGSDKQWAVLVGAAGLFAMVAIYLYVSHQLVRGLREAENDLARSRKSEEELRRRICEKYADLGEFLSIQSASESNPELFLRHFRSYFNVSGGSGAMFGDVVDVVDGAFDGVLTRIKEQCPMATHEDLVLCALLCLGFSPTAVGLVFGNTKPSSIYNRRYRLRKHCSIPAEQNIETWLQELIGE